MLHRPAGAGKRVALTSGDGPSEFTPQRTAAVRGAGRHVILLTHDGRASAGGAFPRTR